MSKEIVVTDDKSPGSVPVVSEDHGDHTIHVVRRGEELEDDSSLDSDIVGYDAERMKARTLLTETEEKKLMRRVDWHLMPLCSIMFLLKNMDYQNVRIPRSQSGDADGCCRLPMLES